MFYEGIVKECVIIVVGLQIDFVVPEVNKHIEYFEEIIAYHAVYVPFAQLPFRQNTHLLIPRSLRPDRKTS